jgi:hypothetical protein
LVLFSPYVVFADYFVPVLCFRINHLLRQFNFEETGGVEYRCY